MKRLVTASAACLALSWRLFARTIGAKYRKSFLGYFWMFAPALLITAGVSLAGRAGIINPGTINLPYPLYVFLGTLLWQIFAEALEVPHQAFQDARSYLTRINFSREAIVLVQLYEALINTAIRLALALLLIAVFVGIDARAAALVALCFGGSILLGLGIGALLMPFMLLFADLYNTVKLFTSYGLFLTPAFYAPGRSGLFATIVHWNPISPLMNSARDAAAGLSLGEPIALLLVLACAILLTIGGMALVRLCAPIVIERMLLGGR